LQSLKIAEPWHVNATRVEDFLVPTAVAFCSPTGAARDRTARGKLTRFRGTPLRPYEGVVVVGAVIDVATDMPLDPSTIQATVTYQACTPRSAYCRKPECQNRHFLAARTRRPRDRRVRSRRLHPVIASATEPRQWIKRQRAMTPSRKRLAVRVRVGSRLRSTCTIPHDRSR
jgi:hypothetical protein